MLIPVIMAAQGEIRRGTLGGAGGTISSGNGSLRGTVSQSITGRATAGTEARFGLWHRALLPASTTIISLPLAEAPVGVDLRIPLRIDSHAGFSSGEVRAFNATIRYNASILELRSNRYDCNRIGDTCYVSISGTTEVRVGPIEYLDFTAKLGNDTGTLLEVVEFEWARGEEHHRVERRAGYFRLLDVCREGDSVRLIHAAPSGARIAITPNPVRSHGSITFTSVEEGETTFRLVDVTGVEVASLGTIFANRARQYRIDFDPTTLASGSYTLLCTTPSDLLTTRILITE